MGFAAWLHEALTAEDWYGTELDRLVDAWASRASTPIVIVVELEREAPERAELDELLRKLEGASIAVVEARSAAP